MKDITCEGRWYSDSERYEISLSSIFSYLIRECGKLVEDYNSDLFYDFKTVERHTTEIQDEGSKVFWIGLRESGVDGEDFIKCRCDTEYYYRGIYKITVEKTMKKCTVTLKKSSVCDFRKEHGM